MRKIIFLLLLVYQSGCKQINKEKSFPELQSLTTVDAVYKTIGDIPPPPDFKRPVSSKNSFENWLRNLVLKKDKAVYLYNGKLKPNQAAQFAVVDMPRSKTDLQQCADVVMRLRAEYLFAEKQYDSIRFMDYNKKWYNWKGGGNRPAFESYLQNVFGWCGSASLEKQLKPIENFDNMKVGNVFVRGGFPGHAMIVADMAVNNIGEKVFMLVQGYQPAQDIHLVLNPLDSEISPWYKVTASEEIITPEWKFYKSQLYRW